MPAAMNRPPKPAKTPELAVAEAAVLRCLAERKYKDAAQVVASYEAKQPVPRGINVDWRKPDLSGDAVALRSICDGPAGATNEIHTAAAMMYLLGVSKPYRRWLSREANGDAEAIKLVLRAFEVRQAEALRRASARGFIP
jgi:hypothetical protein